MNLGLFVASGSASRPGRPSAILPLQSAPSTNQVNAFLGAPEPFRPATVPDPVSSPRIPHPDPEVEAILVVAPPDDVNGPCPYHFNPFGGEGPPPSASPTISPSSDMSFFDEMASMNEEAMQGLLTVPSPPSILDMARSRARNSPSHTFDTPSAGMQVNPFAQSRKSPLANQQVVPLARARESDGTNLQVNPFARSRKSPTPPPKDLSPFIDVSPIPRSQVDSITSAGGYLHGFSSMLKNVIKSHSRENQYGVDLERALAEWHICDDE